MLAGIVINLLIYIDDHVLLARCPSGLDKQLRIIKYFSSGMAMIVNTYKTKIMLLNSNKC